MKVSMVTLVAKGVNGRDSDWHFVWGGCLHVMVLLRV